MKMSDCPVCGSVDDYPCSACCGPRVGLEFTHEYAVTHIYKGGDYAGTIDHEGRFRPAYGIGAELTNAEVAAARRAHDKVYG